MDTQDKDKEPEAAAGTRARARNRADSTARAARIKRANALADLSGRYLALDGRADRARERSAARREKFEEKEAARLEGELADIHNARAALLDEARDSIEGLTSKELRDYFGLTRPHARALLNGADD